MLKSRRKFIKALLSISVYGLTMAGSILQSTMAQTPWLKENFSAGSFDQTMRRLFGAGDIIDSNKIKISRLPRVAENGAIVPITISSTLEHVEKISILVEQNSSPLSAEFFCHPHSLCMFLPD